MDLLAAWLLYPLALAALCLGVGLLVERAADWRLPGVLLLPVGFTGLLVLARLVTDQGATAPFGLAVLALAAGLGFALGHRRLRALRPDLWILAAALGVFIIFAAPVLASGEPSLTGYLALPDTGHQLALAQLLTDRGPDWQSLREGSTYEGLAPYLIGHYPVAAQALLGVTAPLGIIDLAWLYQPLLSFMALLLFLALAALGGAGAAPSLAAGARPVRGRAAGARLRLRAAGVDQGDGDRGGDRLPRRARRDGDPRSPPRAFARRARGRRRRPRSARSAPRRWPSSAFPEPWCSRSGPSASCASAAPASWAG